MSILRMKDEIKIVEYLSAKLRDHLKGNTITQLLYTNPQANVLAGVLFPKEMFEGVVLPGQDVDDGEGKEIKKMAVPLSKNCSIGLDFLVKPGTDQDRLKLSIDCSFDVYIRVFPSFNEQMKFINHGVSDDSIEVEEEESQEAEAIEQIESVRVKQEYPLAEKYEKININIVGIVTEIDLKDNEEIILSQQIAESIDTVLSVFNL